MVVEGNFTSFYAHLSRYLGGGAINLAFAKLLGHDASQNGFQQMHRRLLERAATQPGRLVSSSEASDIDALRGQLGLLASFARLPETRTEGDVDPVGVAFLDVLGDARPLSPTLRTEFRVGKALDEAPRTWPCYMWWAPKARGSRGVLGNLLIAV